MINNELEDRPNLQLKRRRSELCDQITSRVRGMAKVMADASMTDKDLPDAPMGLPDIINEGPEDAPNRYLASRPRKTGNKIDPARSITLAPPPRGAIRTPTYSPHFKSRWHSTGNKSGYVWLYQWRVPTD